MTGGRAPKLIGARVERELVLLLCELGLPCARVPLSGAIGSAWSGDIQLELRGRALKIEVKGRRKFCTLHQWLGINELLILKADRHEPLVVMPVRSFVELAMTAQRARS